jgi:hypothetical protein
VIAIEIFLTELWDRLKTRKRSSIVPLNPFNKDLVVKPGTFSLLKYGVSMSRYLLPLNGKSDRDRKMKIKVRSIRERFLNAIMIAIEIFFAE